MTINKSQGQTFERVGLHLHKPVFAHGQLYVACSRVRSFDSIKVLLPPGHTSLSLFVFPVSFVFLPGSQFLFAGICFLEWLVLFTAGWLE